MRGVPEQYPDSLPSNWFSRVCRKLRRLSVSVLKAVVCCILGFLSIVLIGLIPVNRSFRSAPNGVEIFVISNAVHTDLVFPIENKVMDWANFFSANFFDGDVSQATHVAIGWGDQGFFIETPTWADLKISTALNALLIPSSTCVHVDMLGGNVESVVEANAGKRIMISVEQYEQLVAFVCASCKMNDSGQPLPILGEHYHSSDAFFIANGSYHLLNTCNSWAGNGLRRAGVKVAWFTPLPKTIYMYLPE